MPGLLHRKRLLSATFMVFVWMFATSCALCNEAPSEQAGIDQAAIRAVWRSLDSAWNDRDVERFINLYSDDVSFVFVDRDQRLNGRIAVRERFAAQFPAMAPDLRHVTDVQIIRPIAADAMAIDGRVEVLRERSGADPQILRRFSIFAVMVRQQQVWRIKDLRIYELPTPAENG